MAVSSDYLNALANHGAGLVKYMASWMEPASNFPAATTPGKP